MLCPNNSVKAESRTQNEIINMNVVETRHLNRIHNRSHVLILSNAKIECIIVAYNRNAVASNRNPVKYGQDCCRREND
ncbi:hypothetical protein ACLOJK_034689 [Asimina triloba]